MMTLEHVAEALRAACVVTADTGRSSSVIRHVFREIVPMSATQINEELDNVQTTNVAQ